MADKNFKVKTGLTLPSPLPVDQGGTGQTSANNTLNALLPLQTDNSGKVLKTDGTDTSWVAQAVAYQRGGTASRPVGPTAGDLYYNTDTNIFEQYTSLGWFPIAVAPGSPSGVTATNQPTSRAYNNGQMSVAFTPNTSAGAPSSFVVTPSPSTSPSTFTSSTSPITVTNLASSTQYTYTVTASSAYGTSSASSVSTAVTATTVPAAPSLSAVGASQSATITITPGGTGGSAITGYSIVSSPSTTTQTATSSPYTFTGLTDGTAYTFTATATNANGTSLSSAASNSITPESGSFEQIATTSIGSGGQSFIEFTSIPQNYALLEVRMVGRCAASGAGPSAVALALNSDTTATNYWYGKQESTDGGTGGAATGQTGLVATSVNANNLGLVNNSGLNSNMFSTHIYRLYEYSNSSKNTTVQCYFGYDQGADTILNSKTGFGYMVWKNTNAVNTLRLTASGGNWSQYSHAALYGLKGS